MTSICVASWTCSNIGSDPFLHQCNLQLLRSLWGVYTSLNAHAQEIPHIFDGIQVGTDGRPCMVTHERHSPSGNGCIHEPYEDGSNHAGIQHDLRLAPRKVAKLGPGFYPCHVQRSGCRQWTPNLSDDLLILQSKPWRLDHPTCPIGIHRHPCTDRDVSGKLFLCHLHWNFFSSVNTTWDHCSRVQRWWVRHQATRAWRCLWVSTDPRMADMVGFLQLGDHFRLFWPTLADEVSQWSQLQSVSLPRSCHADVFAGLHDLALHSSHVVDQIWRGRCWSQWCGNILLGARQLSGQRHMSWQWSVCFARLGARQWPDLYEVATVMASWTLFWIPFRLSFIGTVHCSGGVV